jgi:hypothetical protein
MPSFAHDSPHQIVYLTGTQYRHGMTCEPGDEISYSISLSAKRIGFLGCIQIPVLDTIPRFGIVLNIKHWNGRKEVSTLSLDHRPSKVIIKRLDPQNNPLTVHTYIVSEGEVPTSVPFPFQLI